MQIHEQPAHGEPTDETALRISEHANALSLSARVLEELGVVHPGGASRHARETAETKIHFISEGFRGFEPVVGNRAHQGDASARAVAFELRRIVSRARWQAHAAVHALLHH